MTVALGASAYAAAIFHLVTHAFFKALLFLAAGSVIIAMHHEQDMRKMGGLYRYMPVTWFTCLIGSIALIGFPGTSGFFSKDAIIEAVHASTLPAAHMAYYAVLTGVFITALYSFRLFFMTFHGKERMDRHTWDHLHESPAVVTVPLSVLAIPSLLLGGFLIGPMLFEGYFGDAIQVDAAHDVLGEMGQGYHGVIGFTLHAFQHPPVYLALAGVLVAWLLYIRFPALPEMIATALKPVHKLLLNKYGFDDFNQIVFAGGTRRMGHWLWQLGDVRLIDDLIVNGSALSVRWFSGVVRQVQSGYLYHYAFSMIIGLLLLLGLFVHKLI
jgi:NADH-quinone oxidoreductase subunit L